MKPNTINLTQADGYVTCLYPHLTEESKISGTFVIVHGIAEHHSRYDAFASFLNQNGFDVYLFDLRGHGTDKKLDELGIISGDNGEGYSTLVSDTINILDYVHDNNRSNKLILFGHSMGSFIARIVSFSYTDIDAAIFMGTAFENRATVLGAEFLTKFVMIKNGSKTLSPYLNKKIFSSRRYTSLSERTSYDWLSRRHPAVGMYINDPYCGFVCSAAMYHTLARLASVSCKLAYIKNTDHSLPILIISGENDPVGFFGKGPTELFNIYQRLGFSKVDCTLYKDCRHELLQEINRLEIETDISDWVKKAINSSKIKA
jgi:alpha-beta hydrolase superfamily lysophospholipase